MKQIALISLIVASLSVLAACNQASPDPSGQESPFIVNVSAAQVKDSETRDADPANVIKELTLSNGNIVRFIQEQAGDTAAQVGVIEIVQANENSVLSGLTTGTEVSPLELYLALSNEDTAPQALVLNHQLLASANPGMALEPRHLVMDGLTTQTQQVKSCAGMTGYGHHLNFLNWVSSAFGAALPNHGHGQYLTSTHYGITGLSAKRALATCNAAGYAKYVRISYKWSSNLWMNIPIGPTGGTVLSLFPGQALFYYSSSGFLVPQQYRIGVTLSTSGLAGNYAHTEGSW